MSDIPKLSPEQTAALDLLVVLFRESRKGNSEARSTFLGIAIYLAQTNVLDYLVAALLKQAQALNIPPTHSLLFKDMAFEISLGRGHGEASRITRSLQRQATAFARPRSRAEQKRTTPPTRPGTRLP